VARSISDVEIGLIKSLLERGERNVDIQFYFNRQDRPVNTGRISQIRVGTYGPEAPPATEEELDQFLKDFSAKQVGATSGEANTFSLPPTIAARALAQFEEKKDGNWYLREGETTHHECKQSFDPKKMNSIVRAIAAFANNRGGVIYLGVEDAQGRVVGLPDDTFENTDIAQISQKVKNFLTPTPVFIKTGIRVGGLRVGVIRVEKFEEPPIIVSGDGEGLESGSILFRSPGQTAKITAGDLLKLLQERDRATQARLLKSAHRIADIGLNNSLVIDTGTGMLEAEDTRVTIDSKLVDQLKFIREGEFEEIEGAPTLRLVGDVLAVDTEGVVQERIEARALTADSVLRAFLNREEVRTPLEYVRESALVQRQWLPIFYFASLSEEPMERVLEALRTTDAVYSICKAKALERLTSERSAFVAVGRQASPALEEVMAGQFNALKGNFSDGVVARALVGLPDEFRNFDPVFSLLGRIFEDADGDSALKGNVFRAAARLDELAYRKPKN